jgi:hypothetical protein
VWQALPALLEEAGKSINSFGTFSFLVECMILYNIPLLHRIRNWYSKWRGVILWVSHEIQKGYLNSAFFVLDAFLWVWAGHE